MAGSHKKRAGVRALLQNRVFVGVAVLGALVVIGMQVVPALLPAKEQGQAVDPAAARYAKAGPIALIRVHQAIACFQAGSKGMPTEIAQLEAGGCLKLDESMEPAPEASLRRLDIAGSKEWKRIKGLLIRCAGDAELEDDAIIAVLDPLASDQECVYGIDKGGRLTRVERADWTENPEESKRRVGDLVPW